MSSDLDSLDRRILEVLQTDGRASHQQLAQAAGLSTSPAWRRVKNLEEAGVIEGYAALVSREKLGLAVIAYVHISLEDHHPHTVAEFDALIARCPEVMECATLSGQYDYLIKVVAKDIEDYECFLTQKLLPVRGVETANTSIVLKQKKYTTALPVHAG